MWAEKKNGSGTKNGEGEKIQFCQFDTGYDEAEYIAADIQEEIKNGASYHDHAILYRTNAQSRLFEERFVAQNIPYKIVGGVNFYARKRNQRCACVSENH